MRKIISLSALLAASLTLWSAAPVQAQKPYYEGKTIDIVASFAPGGAVDLQARLLAPYFQKHVAGNPQVIVTNRPGGGGILAANWFDMNAKPDGTTLLVSGAGPVLAHLIKLPEAEYNLLEWELVNMGGGGTVFFVRPELEVKSAKDLLGLNQVITLGGMTPTQTDLIAPITFDLLGTADKVRVVFGFEGKGALLQAFERNETQMDLQTTAAAYLSNVQPLVEAGKAVPIMSVGLLDADGNVVRDPSVPDIPTVYEVYTEIHGRTPSEDDVRWRAYKAWLGAGFSFRGGLWAPNGTDPEALKALYEAVDRMNADPQFRQDAKVLVEHFPMLRGDQVIGALRETLSLSPEVQSYLDSMIAKY
jgi:tripartite-type tricarboxylate transporter receptor subunit TctC